MPLGRALACQRQQFSLSDGMHYLNCAFMSPLSERVRQAGIEGIQKEAVPARIIAEDLFASVTRTKTLFSELIGLSDPTRVAVIPAASYGFATVAHNTPVSSGQNVVTLHEQFPSNVHVWRRLCDQTGSELRVVKPPVTGAQKTQAWNESILAAIDRDTAMVAMGSVHWTDGPRFDLASIGERAREMGSAFVIDGTQSIGIEPFDIERIRPDALVCAGYKWLTGPYSLGVAFYGSRYDHGVPIEETWSSRVGAEDFAGLVNQGQEYRSGAARYDVGEAGSFVLAPMLVAGLEQLLEWGVQRVSDYVGDLTGGLFASDRFLALSLVNEKPDVSHIFGLKLPDAVDPTGTAAHLKSRGIHVSVRGQFVRVSPHIYNDTADLEALVSALESALVGVR